MAELSVGLAKSVVEGTLSKAQAAIAEEAKLRDSAQRDLVFITGEFEMMQSFLRVANTERVENPVVLTWVRQIRDLAYDVEDCIEFVVHLDKKASWWFRMIPSCMAPALQLDDAVDQIQQLKARVVDVSTRNTRYSLISDTGTGYKPAVVQQNPAPATTTLTMLVGAGTSKMQADLSQLLARNDHNDLGVISLWGSESDLGVASIIWKAYNDQEIRQNFTCRAWVKIMHPFNAHEFIQCLTDQFYANTCKEQESKTIIGLDVLKRSMPLSEMATQAVVHRQKEHVQPVYMEARHLKQLEEKLNEQKCLEANLLEELENKLNGQRYLVVLDGLSSMKDWDTVSNFFPDKKNGSCIIVSTQQPEVAMLAVGHPYRVWELNQFSEHHSVYAFYKEISQCDVEEDVKYNAAQEWMKEHCPIGRVSEMTDLRQYTSKARFQNFQVISVWGIAGVGKSSLLKGFFCDRILHDIGHIQFEKYAWVDVSYPFSMRDFSRSLLLNFQSPYLLAKKNFDIDTVGSQNPSLECRRILENGKCLVVIDGLQSVKEWDLIQAEMVSEFSRNCIVIITTEARVAKHCRGKKGALVFNVKGLQADDAFALFKKEVSSEEPLPDTLTGSDTELQELISKCGGLPKVIVDVARSLATLPARRMEGARLINENFMNHLENNQGFDSIQGLFTWMHSYFRTCPDSLKPCIFYLSIFPRDSIFRRRRLVRRWIAEGYSRDNYQESAEHNGERQFSDLLDLSIIQQSQKKSAIGERRMVMCQVNGFIHEYIVNRRMEENLVFELGHNCTLTTQRTGRHLVILKHWDRDNIVFESIDFSRLRSLTVFGQWESFFISESMKLLRVLDLEDASGSVEYEDLEKMVKLLRRLKFLSLRGRREIHHLPSSLGHLRQLESLDIRHTSIITLPENITKLEKLQYIRAGTTDIPVSVPPPHISSGWFCKHHSLMGVEVPRGIRKLTALHTLGVVNVAASGSKSFVKDLKKLTQLHKLAVCGINKKNSKDFFSAIRDHAHLESLSVWLNKNNNQEQQEQCGCFFSKDNNQGCLDDMISLPCKNLRSLKLHGLGDRLPKWGPHRLRMLSKLDLEMARLLEEDIKFLAELPELCILRIKQLGDAELHFCVIVNEVEDDSYKKVKVLEIACGCSSSRSKVTFGSKTMKKLELLKVDCSGESSYEFTGIIKNLTELKEIVLVKGSSADELKDELQTTVAEYLREHPDTTKNVVIKMEEPPLSS